MNRNLTPERRGKVSAAARRFNLDRRWRGKLFGGARRGAARISTLKDLEQIITETTVNNVTVVKKQFKMPFLSSRLTVFSQ
jgi:hypothetical protein